MAVAHDTHSESHAGAVGSISEGSFAWSHAGAASGIDGVLVSVHGLVTSDDDVLSVDYGGKAIPAVTGGRAVDTTTEPMSCKTFFYGGTDIPQGTQTVTVTRNNTTNELWAEAITVTCSTVGKVGAVHEAGIVLLEGDGTLTGQSVTDGSPGTDSLRYAFISSGLAGAPSAHASSTLLGVFDTGNQTTSSVVETTGGQGARTVGFASGTSDDRAAVHFAVKEADAPAAAFTLDAQSGSYALTGAAASVPAARQVTATAGSYSVTGAAASVPAGRVVSASPGAYTLTGFAADLVFTGGGAAAFSINAESGSYTITGTASSPVAGRVVNASAGVYALTGAAAGLLAGRLLGALPGAYTVTGSDATLSLPGAYTLDASPGSYALTGSAAGAVAGRAINAASGSYATTGAAAGLLPIRLLLATPGSYALAGSTAGLASSGEEAVTLYFFDQPSPSMGFDAEWVLAGAVYGVTVYGASIYGGTANTRFDAPSPAKVLV